MKPLGGVAPLIAKRAQQRDERCAHLAPIATRVSGAGATAKCRLLSDDVSAAAEGGG